MGNIWKGPGVLWGLGKKDPVHPGKPIPKGHVPPERLKQLGDRVVNEEVEARKAAEKEAAEKEAEARKAAEKEAAEKEAAEKDAADETSKRGPGRPPGSKNK